MARMQYAGIGIYMNWVILFRVNNLIIIKT